jgi:hypothetical protein
MPKHFTDDEWRRLPLALRKRWWRETDYGKRPPSRELLAACISVLLEGAVDQVLGKEASS